MHCPWSLQRGLHYRWHPSSPPILDSRHRRKFIYCNHRGNASSNSLRMWDSLALGMVYQVQINVKLDFKSQNISLYHQTVLLDIWQPPLPDTHIKTPPTWIATSEKLSPASWKMSPSRKMGHWGFWVLWKIQEMFRSGKMFLLCRIANRQMF